MTKFVTPIPKKLAVTRHNGCLRWKTTILQLLLLQITHKTDFYAPILNFKPQSGVLFARLFARLASLSAQKESFKILMLPQSLVYFFNNFTTTSFGTEQSQIIRLQFIHNP